MKVALILSGGTGLRLGSDIPKQYIEVAGRPIISYCLETLSSHEEVEALQIVADPAWQDLIWNCLRQTDSKKKFRGFSEPGENRQLSIFHGLQDIRTYAEDSGYVFIHDAARPCLSPEQITDCLQGAEGHEGLMPVLPMKDTVYTSLDGGKALRHFWTEVRSMRGRRLRCSGLDDIMRQIKSFFRTGSGRSTVPQSRRCWMGWRSS